MLLITNFTDIDDKIIRRAAETGREPLALSAEFARIYLEDLATLGVQAADAYPRVTEHMPEIIDLVERLVGGGHAYQVDGDVYFSIASFPGYGKLSGRTEEEMEAGARVEVDPRKTPPDGFRPMEGGQTGRAGLGLALGPGQAGLAHRMLRHVPQIPGTGL